MSRLAIGAALGAGLVGILGGSALAAGDNTLESSAPAAGEVVTVAPTQIQLKFTLPVGGPEAVAKMGLSLSCESKLTNLGPPQLAADGVTVSAALTQIPDNGNCVVSWSLPDGSTGTFSFTSQAQATTTVPPTTLPGETTTVPGTPTEATPTIQPRLGGPVGLVRWLSFFFVAALFGAIIFVRTVWPEGVEYAVTDRYLRQVTVLAFVSVYLLAVFMDAREGGGSIAASLSPTSWGDLASLTEGRAVFVRLVLVGVLGFYVRRTSHIFNPQSTVQLTVALVVLMASFGFDRALGRGVAIGVVLNVVHMTLVCTWVGFIAIVWRIVLLGPGEIDLVHALRGWVRWSTPLAVGVIVTGSLNLFRLDDLSVFNSGHGRVALLKLFLTVGLLLVGGAVRQFIHRGLAKAQSLNERAVYRLKRPVGVELTMSMVILAASSWLMSMRPPYVLLPDKSPVVEYAVVVDMTGKDDFHVRLSLSPGNVGANRILVELFGPKRIQNFTVSLTPENTGFSGYTIYVPITRPGGALVGTDSGMLLRAPGTWRVAVNGVTTVGELEQLTGSFVIADGVTVTTLPREGATTTSTTPTASTPVPGATIPTNIAVTTTTAAPPG